MLLAYTNFYTYCYVYIVVIADVAISDRVTSMIFLLFSCLNVLLSSSPGITDFRLALMDLCHE